MPDVKRTVCLCDCPDTCALRVTVDNGAVVAVTGDPDHPTTRGFICEKTRLVPERLASPDRLLYPMLRAGPKGSGQFRRATWDEAIDLVAQRWRAIIAKDGAEAIMPFSYLGTKGIINSQGFDRRFFHALGATKQGHTICSSAGREAYQFTIGAQRGLDPEHFSKARLYIIWGRNITSTLIHEVPMIQAARRQGARVVLIDPFPLGNRALADQVLMPFPGTDAALTLGLMHVIIAEGLHDQDFVARHTLGFAELAGRVAEFPPERVASITGLSAADIIGLARTYARTHPSLIRPGVGMTHAVDGDMAIRNMACLAGLTGAWRYPGGGLLFGNGGWAPLNQAALRRPDLAPPGVRTINMVQLGQALASADPPLRSLYVHSCNPAVVVPDQGAVLAGLAREDLFLVVHELMMTDTCRFADVILPACSQFEFEDITTSSWSLYLHHNPRLIAPAGEAKSNTEVFRLLARALGLTDPCLHEDDETLLETALDHPQARARGITLASLREQGWVRVRSLDETATPYRDGFPTASGKLEFYSQALADKGRDPLPGCNPPAADPAYPLYFIGRSSRYFLNSSFANLPARQRREQGRPTLFMHPEDAGARRIRTGSLVRLVSARGECRLHAQVTPDIRPGVVATNGLWWLRSMDGGKGINALVDATISMIGGGPAFNNTRVQVQRVSRKQSEE